MTPTPSAEKTAVPTSPLALSAVAQRLRATGISTDLEPVRDAFPGTQTATAALWLSTRLGAATEAYADRIDARAKEAVEAVEATERERAEGAGA